MIFFNPCIDLHTYKLRHIKLNTKATHLAKHKHIYKKDKQIQRKNMSWKNERLRAQMSKKNSIRMNYRHINYFKSTIQS